MRSDHPAAETPLPFTVHDAMEQAETGHAAADQVRMARGVANMFDDLRAMADHHVDRARLEAEIERERAELEQARRPWRRAIGR
jgi:hypothetical protein